MTSQPPKPGDPPFTLKGEVQKRRTQEIVRSLEAKQTGPLNKTPAAGDSGRGSQYLDSVPVQARPTSQGTQAVQNREPQRTTTPLPIDTGARSLVAQIRHSLTMS